MRGSDQLQAAVAGLKGARRDVRNTVNRATRATLSPVWKQEVESRVSRRADVRVFKGARIVAGNPPYAVAATSKRALSGGLVPATGWQGLEFGAVDPGRVTTYTRRSAGGGTHQVTRHTARQLPRRFPKGRVVYPALGDLGPRLASLWVSVIVRVFNDAAEQGGKA